MKLNHKSWDQIVVNSIDKRVIDGNDVYLCNWSKCGYSVESLQLIESHIKVKHLDIFKFKSNESNGNEEHNEVFVQNKKTNNNCDFGNTNIMKCLWFKICLLFITL